MSTLLVGFDSAWTATHCGALAGVLRTEDGTYQYLDDPLIASFCEGSEKILEWQKCYNPNTTIILLDQPIIVKNAGGQRLVESIVSPSVGRCYGGMQPANTSKMEMFGVEAPVWQFLNRFGGPADPFSPVAGIAVFETYPVLAMIALDWVLPNSREAGRLPKYNPERKKTFSIRDWQHVCQKVSDEFRKRDLQKLVLWLDNVTPNDKPCKQDQDKLDACICLLVALNMSEQRECLMIGDMDSGYIVVPNLSKLCDELKKRCNVLKERYEKIQLIPSELVRSFHLTLKQV